MASLLIRLPVGMLKRTASACHLDIYLDPTSHGFEKLDTNVYFS